MENQQEEQQDKLLELQQHQREDSQGDNQYSLQHHKDSLDEVKETQQMDNQKPRVLSLSSKPLNGNDEPSDIDAEIGFSQAFEEIDENQDEQENKNKNNIKENTNEKIINKLIQQNILNPQSQQLQQQVKQNLEDSLEQSDLIKARMLVEDHHFNSNYEGRNHKISDKVQGNKQQGFNQLSKVQSGNNNEIQEILEEEQQYYNEQSKDQANIQEDYQQDNQLEQEYEYTPDEDRDFADQEKQDPIENYEDSCGIIPPQNVKREPTSSTAGFKDIASKRTFDYEQFESFLQAQQQQQQKRKLVYPEAVPDTSPRFSFNTPVFMQVDGSNNNNNSGIKKPNLSGMQQQQQSQKESMLRRSAQEYAFQRDSDMMTVNSDDGDFQKQFNYSQKQIKRNGQGSLGFGSQKMQKTEILRGGGSDDERFTNVKEVILDEQQEIPEELQSTVSKNTQQQLQTQPLNFNEPKRLSNTSMATIESREDTIGNQANLGISQQKHSQQQMLLSSVKQAVDIKKIVADQVDEIVSARLLEKNERINDDRLDNEQVFRQIIREELKRFLQQNQFFENNQKDGLHQDRHVNKKKEGGSISSTPRSLRLSSPRDNRGEEEEEEDRQQGKEQKQNQQPTSTEPPQKVQIKNFGNLTKGIANMKDSVQQRANIAEVGSDIQLKKKKQQYSKSLRDIRFESNQLTNQEIDVIIEESLQKHSQTKPSWQSTKEITIPQISKKVEFQDQITDSVNQSESSPGFKTFTRNDGSSRRKIEMNQVSSQKNNQQTFPIQPINQEQPMVISHQRIGMSDSRKDYGAFPEISFSVNRLQSNQHVSRSNESNGSIVGFSPTLLQNPNQTAKLPTQLLSPIAQGNNTTLFSMKNPGNIRSAHSRLLSGISRDSSREAIREFDEEGKMMAMMMESSILDREGDQQQYQQQSIESVQRLHQAAFLEQQDSRSALNAGYLPSRNTRNGNYIYNHKTNNINPLPILGQEVSSIWEKALEFQARGQLSRAYQLILDIEDDVYLLRLMSISGPCFSKLSQNIGRKLIKRINRITASKFLDQMSLQLFENTVQMDLLSDLNLEDTLSMKEILYDISASPILGEQASNLYNTIDREEHE